MQIPLCPQTHAPAQGATIAGSRCWKQVWSHEHKAYMQDAKLHAMQDVIYFRRLMMQVCCPCGKRAHTLCLWVRP